MDKTKLKHFLVHDNNKCSLFVCLFYCFFVKEAKEKETKKKKN